MTIGQLHEPFHHPASKGFVDRAPGVYEAAGNSPGFISRSFRNFETLSHSWGPVNHPKCFGGETDSHRLPSTLSIWEDLESVAAFAYSGVHGEALSKRKEWFASTGKPTYVAFWVGDDVESVDWQEAADRLDYLHEHGSTAHAFNFKQPFDADGNPMTLDRDKMRSGATS